MVILNDIFFRKKTVFVLLFSVSFFFSKASVELLFPKNNYTTLNTTPVLFEWSKGSCAQLYKIQIAKDSIFTILVLDTIVNSNTISYKLTNTGTYFWRAIAVNKINTQNFNTIFVINPKDIGDLRIWISADTLIQETGGLVFNWGNLANSSNPATQSSNSFKPQTTTFSTLLSNKKAISFGFSSPSLLNFTTSVPLVQYSYIGLMDYKPNTPVIEYFLTGIANGFFIRANYFNNTGLGVYGLDGNAISINSSNYQTDTPFIGSIKPNEILVNNSKKNLELFQPSSSLNISSIGTRPDAPSLNYQGRIGEIFLYAETLDSINTTKINNYLFDKYSPPINLGNDITFGNLFCDSMVYAAENRFVSYLWNDGDTSRIKKISTNNSLYTLKVTDIFGRKSEDKIRVLPFVPFNSDTIIACAGETVRLKYCNIDTTKFTFNWSTGSTNTFLDVSVPGRYTLIIKDLNGCTFKDTVFVKYQTNNFIYNKQFINDSISLCVGEKLYINNYSSTNTYLWSNTSTQNFLEVYTPGLYWLKVVTLQGCIFIDTFYVKISGTVPTANFVTNSACLNSTTTFLDNSISPIDGSIVNWSWSFGNGSNSTVQNPSTIYTTNGTYLATLKITTTTGCSDSIAKLITVNKKPIPSFYNQLSCEKNTTKFIDQTIANAASITNWNWNFSTLGQVNGIQNPSFNFQTTGTYNVQLKTTNSFGCSDSITQQVVVNSIPVASFKSDTTCGNSPVTFSSLSTITSPNTISSWRWDFGDGTFETVIRNPQHAYSSTGTYPVRLIVRSSNQCTDTIQKNIKVFDYPTVNFSVSPTQCVNKKVYFTDNTSSPDGTPITNWNWFFSGQGTSLLQNPNYTFNTEGNYTIQLTAKNAAGCLGTKLYSIAITKPPLLNFTFSPSFGLPPLNVAYSNQSTTNATYFWNYGDGTSIVSGYNPPNHTYTVRGNYPIQLITSDLRGCTDTLTKYILVDNAYLDGVMAAVNIIPNGNFYRVLVTISNNSNIEITQLGLSLQIGNGSKIRENWSGVLQPNTTTIYEFVGQINIGNNEIPIVCASIDNINNNSPENNINNNTTCKETSVGDFNVLNIYPNPATESINFGVMLPQDGLVSIGFIDALGQIEYNKEFNGTKGYNTFNITTLPLNAAVYVAVIQYNGITIRKKFMRTDKK